MSTCLQKPCGHVPGGAPQLGDGTVLALSVLCSQICNTKMNQRGMLWKWTKKRKMNTNSNTLNSLHTIVRPLISLGKKGRGGMWSDPKNEKWTQQATHWKSAHNCQAPSCHRRKKEGAGWHQVEGWGKAIQPSYIRINLTAQPQELEVTTELL